MKITKRQLRRIIKEELALEGGAAGHMGSSFPLDDETISQQFKKWATEYMGSPAGANSSSVLATFLVQHGYDKDENLVADMAGDLGFDLRDVSMEVKRQRREYDVGGALSDEEIYQGGFMEATMKITKRQLKRIIKEEKRRLNEQGGLDISSTLKISTENAEAVEKAKSAIAQQLNSLYHDHMLENAIDYSIAAQ